MKEGYLDFDAYIRQGEPDKREKASIWRTAIGLQAVDGLQTSAYLRETAVKHIEGEIDIDEARQLIKTYYQSDAMRVTSPLRPSQHPLAFRTPTEWTRWLREPRAVSAKGSSGRLQHPRAASSHPLQDVRRQEERVRGRLHARCQNEARPIGLGSCGTSL
jgi:hypothetical protein